MDISRKIFDYYHLTEPSPGTQNLQANEIFTEKWPRVCELRPGELKHLADIFIPDPLEINEALLPLQLDLGPVWTLKCRFFLVPRSLLRKGLKVLAFIPRRP